MDDLPEAAYQFGRSDWAIPWMVELYAKGLKEHLEKKEEENANSQDVNNC